MARPSAGGDGLDNLANPDLAHLPAAELVVHLSHSDRSGSDFADVALVLAVRERRLAEAEARIRALELRAANAEALARRSSPGSDSGGCSGAGRAVAREDDHQSRASLEPQIVAAELMTGGEIRPRDLTASETIVVPERPAGEIEDGEITPAEIKATPAEIGDNKPRPSPLRRISATATLQVPAASSMPDELGEERAVDQQVVVDVAVRGSHDHEAAQAVDSRDEVSEAVAGKRRKETAATSVSQEKEEEHLEKKPKPAGAYLGVASDYENSDSDSQVEETELCFTEEEGWKMLDFMKAQVAAWESEFDAPDAAQGTLQAAAAPPPPPPPVEEPEVQTVIEADEAREASEATVARLQEQIILYERRLKEVKDSAKKTEERLCDEITKCKDEATKTEAGLWREILTRDTELEVWKHSATESQAQIRAASKTVAGLRDEIQERKNIAAGLWREILDRGSAVTELEVWKHSATQAQAQIRAASKTVAGLRDEIQERKNIAVGLWREILDRGSAVTELEVWKHSATQAQAQIHAASKTVAGLRDEINDRKLIASETVACLDYQDKVIAKLNAMVDEGKHKLAKAEASEQNRAIEVEAQIRQATKIEEDLQAKIRALELKVADLEARGSGSGISRSDRAVAVGEHSHSRMVPEIELHRVVPATGATKKAPRQRGVSFYDKFFKSEMEKMKLTGDEENDERLRKQAAEAASEALYLRCFSEAPHLPAQLRSHTVEDDSDEEA